jgi:hypothetical protein
MMTRLRRGTGGCEEGPDQCREVIKHREKLIKDYPKSEASDAVRTELANAFAACGIFRVRIRIRATRTHIKRVQMQQNRGPSNSISTA